MNTPKDGEGNMDSQDQSQAGGGVAAHTPRPWFLEGDDILGGSDLNVIGHPFGDTAEQARANGLAQAAALDLLAALKRLIPTNIDLTNNHVPDATILPCDVTLGELRTAAAAISKALGQ